MRICCLGPLAAVEDDRDLVLGGPKQRLVLAHLLIRANQTVPVDRLIAEVWGDDPPRAVRSSLQSFISHLRKALGPDRIDGGGHGYALRVDTDEVDRMRFEALLTEGRRLRASDPAAAVTVLGGALDLWQGAPFADLAEDRSLQPEIARLEELRATVVEDRAAAAFDCGADRELVAELEAHTAELPLRERRWALLMTALYRAGRQADALAAFERARGLLADELGIDPSPELRTLHERILRQDPSLLNVVPALKGYRLVERVGDGPFGVVWRATQPGVHREVAVKVVHPALADDGDFIRRFEADAQRVAHIQHPHVAPLYDFWREPGGAYLVRRFLDGGDLTQRLVGDPSGHRAADLRTADEITQALAAAHRQGVVHGNLKPSNVLFDDDGNAYLVDFSIAVHGNGRVRQRDRAYLAPELRNGAAPDPRTDVYALGVLLSDLLPDPDGDLARVLERATERDAASRHGNAGELLADLRAASGTVTPAPDAAGGPVRRNPYKGLRPFSEADATDFFGREALVAHLLARLREDGPGTRFLAIVGPSGSGKSSVARAGLVPALRTGALPGSSSWFVAQMVPGDRPFDALATALRRVAADAPDDLADRLRTAGRLDEVAGPLLPDDGDLVVLIDQFEELFTRTDEETRDAFVDALVDAITGPDSRMRVIVTLRADFYDRPLEHRDLATLVRRRTEAVVPLGPDDLERAVSGPAELVGVRVEPALVAQMIADVTDQPGALPLLQYALTELFDRRTDIALTAAAYHRIGSVAGALARRADGIYTDLPDDAQEAARQAFLRLVTPGDGVDDTRRRTTIAEVHALAPDQMPAVLEAFGDARLLAFDRDPETREPTVEVAHEALLREWRRLAGWIDAAREDLRVHRRLHAAAAEWRSSDRDPSYLSTGSRLEQYERWRAASGLALSELESEHLDASIAARDRAAAEDAARREREAELERRSVHRLRILVGVLATAALVAGGLTIVAVTQAGRAADQSLRAEGQARIASARELSAAAVASLPTDAERGMLLAMEAIAQTRDVDGTVLPEAEEALHRAVTSSRVVSRVPDIGGAVDWGAAGEVFVTEGPEDTGLIDIRDARTGESVRSWRGHDIDVNDAVFSPDGSLLGTTGDDGAATVWDPDTGEEVARISGEGVSEVWGPSFSSDGTRFSAASPDGSWAKVVDTTTNRTLATFGGDDEPWATTLSPDGDRVAIGTRATAAAVVYDVGSRDELFSLGESGDAMYDLAWSPDANWIATAGFDGTVRLWDARTGEARITVFGGGQMRDVDWSEDSRLLAAGGDDGTATVWRLVDGGAREELTLAGRDTGNGVRGVALSPDSQQLLTGDVDVTAAVIWDVSDAGDAEWTNLPVDPELFSPVAFTPDSRNVVVTGPRGVVTMHDAETGAAVVEMPEHRSPYTYIETLDVHRDDGAIAAAVNVEGPNGMAYAARVWDSSGEPSTAVDGDGWIFDVAWHPTDDVLAFATLLGEVHVVDSSGAQLAVLRQEPDTIAAALEFSPDGTLLAAATFRRNRFEGEVELWDWQAERRARRLDVFAQGIAFSPDGRHVATAEITGRARVWDVRTRQPVTTLEQQSGMLFTVSYSPDGRTIATAGADRTIRLWGTSTGTERLRLAGHEAPIGSLAFSRDGTKLASGGQDGLARVWALDLDDLVAIAEGELTRDLTTAECRQFLHTDECPRR